MEQGKLHLVKFQKRWQLFSYAEAVLYALGIGFQKDPLDEEHFRYTYEFSD